MNAKKRVFKYLLAVAVAFVALLLVFWWSGASVLPFGERDFVGNARMIKPWVVYDQKPEKLLVTNSRGLYGYDLSLFADQDPYNFSLTGVGTYEIGRIVKHALYASDKNPEFYIGLDTICGELKTRLGGSFYNDDYLLSEPELFIDLKRIKSLISSPADIIRRKIINKPGIDKFGFQAGFPDKNYVTGGIYESLQARELMDYGKFEFEANCDTSAFEDLLAFLYQNKVEFILFINPKHVRTYIAYQVKDQLNSYFNMLADYVAINDELAQKHNTDAAKIKFFADVNEYSTEQFPLNGDVFDPMKYWYENSHFKSTVGYWVLNELFSNSDQHILSMDNIDRTIATLKFDIETFIDGNPELENRIKQVVRKASSDE